jgi:hypothetical protein
MQHSLSPLDVDSVRRWNRHAARVPQSLVNIAHTGKAKRTKSISSHEPRGSLAKINPLIAGTFKGRLDLLPVQIQEVDTMTKILLATVAILAFTAPSFAQDKTVGQAPPSGASSFYLAQDTATMKCQIVNAQPAAGASTKVIGSAHRTQAEAQTALAAEKTCIK